MSWRVYVQTLSYSTLPHTHLCIVAHDEPMPRWRAKRLGRAAGHQQRVQRSVVRRLGLHEAAMLRQRHFAQASQRGGRKDGGFHGEPARFTSQWVLFQPSDTIEGKILQ